MSDVKPGLHFDMPESDYHSHKGSLSTSMAKQLLPPGCPAKFKANLGTPWIKPDFDFGNVVHKLVLGKGDEIDVLTDEEGVAFDSRRTNAYKAAEKAAREANRIPILAKDFVPAQGAANSVLNHPNASALLGAPGEAEVSAFFTDEETGVLRRVRWDFLPNVVEGKRLQQVDLKTAESSEPEAFGKKAADYGYAMQAAAYSDAVIALGLDADPMFWFVTVEKDAPYIVSVLYASDDMLQIGRYLNRKALRIYAECLATDVWPTYQPEPAAVPLPAWFTFNHQEAFSA